MGANRRDERPPESWRRAFEEQATDEMLARAVTYAEARTRILQRVAGRADPLVARDLVLDAMSDTFARVVTWDPERAPLEAHLCRVIRRRTSHELRRAKRFVHLSLDDTGTSADALEEATSNAIAVAQSGSNEHMIAARACGVVNGIKRLAGNDEAVLQLLAALEAGATARHHVIEMTGMSAIDYHNARRRLRRLADQLPEDVREDAQVLA